LGVSLDDLLFERFLEGFELRRDLRALQSLLLRRLKLLLDLLALRDDLAELRLVLRRLGGLCLGDQRLESRDALGSGGLQLDHCGLDSGSQRLLRASDLRIL